MSMRRPLSGLFTALLLTLPVAAGPFPVGAHYPVGSEGIRAASLPPPGFYLRDYNMGYYANEFGRVPIDFHAAGYVNAPRAIWFPGVTLLGADYGMDVIIPFGYREMKINGQKFDDFGLGDVAVEPLLLSWHLPRFDFSLGYAIWAPTGDFDTSNPAKLGQGYCGHMATFGATAYLDTERTWAFSVLNRYEISHEQRHTHLTPGQFLTTEFGLSKTLAKTVDLGVIGYTQQQTTDERGTGASNERSRVIGLGPEISLAFPSIMTFASLRYVREFEAAYRPEGHLLALTVTKRF